MLSFKVVEAARKLFELGIGWKGEINANKITKYPVIYLETVAAVPFMVAGIFGRFVLWSSTVACSMCFRRKP
jgi:hypothetical protein